MTKFNPPINKPLDRAYFKYKDNPKDENVPKYMPCCGEEVDNDYLDVNNPEDWELIENYIEDHLFDYSSTESITPRSCEECGRLIEYISELNEKAWRIG